MNPEVPRVLTGLAATLTQSIRSELTTPFGQASAMTAAGLLSMAAGEFDGAAARYVEENDAIRAILAEEALRRQCAEVVANKPERDYRVSTLKAENDQLRAALIDLHAHVEGRSDGASCALDERIWEELCKAVARRSFGGS